MKTRLVSTFAILLATGCASNSAERAGRKIYTAAQKTGKAVKKAGQKTGQALQKAGRKVGEAFD